MAFKKELGLTDQQIGSRVPDHTAPYKNERGIGRRWGGPGEYRVVECFKEELTNLKEGEDIPLPESGCRTGYT